MENLYATLDAIRVLRAARLAVVHESQTAWELLANAGNRLEKEVAAHVRGL
jgi:hypothetical protein